MATLVQPRLRHTRLRRSPLATVIAQVRFSPVLRVADRGFIAPFQDAIRGDYPALAEELEQGLLIAEGGIQNLPGRRQWRFSSIDEDWSLLLADSALTLETRTYRDADDFLERFSRCLSALADTVNPQLLERIGLRYVNECRHPQGTSAVGWRGLVSPEFLGPIESQITQRYQVQRTLQQIQIGDPNEGSVVIRQGFFPSGSTVKPMGSQPSRDPGPFYLLDFDHFITRREAFDVASIATEAARFHAVIWDLFKLSLTDALYDYFEPER